MSKRLEGNPQENQPLKADVMLITNPVPLSRIKLLEVFSVESRITYQIDSPTTVYSPIAGKVKRIQQQTAKGEFTIDIENDTTTAILAGLDTLYVNQGEHLNSGQRLGAVNSMGSFQTKDIYLTVASDYTAPDQYAILKMR